MPDRDPSLELNDLPEIQTDKREPSNSGSSSKPPKPPASSKKGGGEPPSDKPPVSKAPRSRSNAGIWAALGVLILCVVGLSFWNRMLLEKMYKHQDQVLNAQERIQGLEGRLSSTDENVSQSGIAMQVRLKDLEKRTDDLWAQMDKLWASAWRRNQTDIKKHSSQVKSLQARAAELDKRLDSREESAKTTAIDMTALRAEVEDLGLLAGRLDESAKALAATNASLQGERKKIDALQSSVRKLQTGANEFNDWLESNKAFRRQVNIELDGLEKKVQALQSPAKAAP
ncbi:Uncharacterised protein [BD1-7 clade bacterium]|uniref:Uncharacterized protein n=1 Tax=BD1-7 clade bacterium TaxID=2029982 RepID=A0A5S9QX92_9GAMM|nr:Uncharacterised protein [BD1-7 clade bacterium]